MNNNDKNNDKNHKSNNENENLTGDRLKGDRYEVIRRIDREIDRSGDSARIGKRDRLREDGVNLLARSHELMEKSLLLAKRADSLIKEREGGKTMGYERVDSWYREVEEVEKLLKNIDKEIWDMELEYKKLRNRVNKFYGIDVILDYDKIMDILFNEDNTLDYSTPGEGGIEESNKRGKEDEIGFDLDEGFKEGDADWWKE